MSEQGPGPNDPELSEEVHRSQKEMDELRRRKDEAVLAAEAERQRGALGEATPDIQTLDGSRLAEIEAADAAKLAQLQKEHREMRREIAQGKPKP